MILEDLSICYQSPVKLSGSTKGTSKETYDFESPVTKLPVEVVDLIISFVGPASKLKRLSMVCKLFHERIDVMIYHDPVSMLSRYLSPETQDTDSAAGDREPHEIDDEISLENEHGGYHLLWNLKQIAQVLRRTMKRQKNKLITIENRCEWMFRQFQSKGHLVRMLDLSHVQVSVRTDYLGDNKVYNIIRDCPYVVQLNMTGCSAVSDFGLSAVMHMFGNLRCLNLSDCELITDVTLHRIALVAPNLSAINLKHCVQLTDVGLMDLTSTCRLLQRIRVYGCTFITDAAMKSISKSHSDCLLWLDIGQCDGIGDEGIISIAQSCHRLQWIDISRSLYPGQCQVTNKSIEAVVDGCPDLELLDLSYWTLLSDDTLCHLAKKCVSLKSLSLKGLDVITRRSILELGELRRKYRRLIWLQIYNCRFITGAVIDEMIERLNDGWRKVRNYF